MSNWKDEVADYKQQLQDWTRSLGLLVYQPDESIVETILGMDRSDIQNCSSVQLSEYSIILAQYSLFLQQKTNECQTFLTWTRQVGNRISGDDRHRMVLWTRKAELRNTRIAYLTRRIEVLGQTLAGLVRSRYNEGSGQ